MREITFHQVGPLNKGLKVTSHGEPGAGGAYNRYHITTVETPPPVGRGMSHADLEKGMAMSRAVHDIHFQQGSPAAVINGISNEVLIAIVMDRLHCFQAGPNPCNENMQALTKLKEAMDLLHGRTCDRIARHVEGTSAQ